MMNETVDSINNYVRRLPSRRHLRCCCSCKVNASATAFFVFVQILVLLFGVCYGFSSIQQPKKQTQHRQSQCHTQQKLQKLQKQQWMITKHHIIHDIPKASIFPSLIVLHAIDETAVTNAVSIPTPSPKPIPPPPKPSSTPSSSSNSVQSSVPSSIDPMVAVAVGVLGLFAIGTFVLRGGGGGGGRDDKDGQSGTLPSSLSTTSKVTSKASSSSSSSSSVSTEISVPYDSAAWIEYEAWKKRYNKENSNDDPKLFETFKLNYYKVTVANVVRKKMIREIPPIQELDETADTQLF